MNSNNLPKFVFDFDGTLVDSMKQWSAKMLKVLQHYNIKYPNDIIKIITPLGDKGTANYFIEAFGIDSTPEKLIEMMDSFAYEEYKSNIPAKETVIDTLKKLKSSGYSLNVLTASPHKMLDMCLQRLKIYDIFDNVWSCDDFGTTKSNPDIYVQTAKKLGTTVDNCIFLDDNINALRTAKQAGMRVIGVYDQSSEEFTEDIKELCGDYINSFSQLQSLL